MSAVDRILNGESIREVLIHEPYDELIEMARIDAKYANTSYIKTDSDNNNDSISDNYSGNTNDGISDNCSDTNICSFTYELDLTASDKGVFEWDTFTPYLYVFDIDLCDESGSVLDNTKAVCGLRSLKADGNDLLLNNRPIFLRGRHCGLLFPMTGFAPMNAGRNEW